MARETDRQMLYFSKNLLIMLLFGGDSAVFLGPHLMGWTDQLGCTGVWTAELGLINMAL